MTPEEFAAEMARIARDAKGDPEAAHSYADKLMLKVLEQHGYGEGCAVFEKMDKWYA